ncbi:MAG: M17 family metallopeptidase, partial [Mycobacteriales bacterium]
MPAAAVVAVLVTPGPTVLGEPPVELTGLLARESAKGEAGEIVSAPQPEGDLERVLAVGVGDGTPASLRKAGAAAARKAKGAATLAIDLRGAALDGEGVRALLEGALLASYGFTRKKESEPRTLHTVTLVVPDAQQVQPYVDRAIAVTRATAAARDLVNTPSLDKTPQWLADAARGLLKGLTVRVRDEKELAKQGFGGIIGVGQGSTRPPRLIEVTYDGGGSRHVVLIGKGITFDTGGLSLKPNDGMLAMKSDMGGGAAVLGTLRAIADLGLRIKVTGLVA